MEELYIPCPCVYQGLGYHKGLDYRRVPGAILMQQFPIQTDVLPWHFRTPTVYRCIPATYVDAFFNDGSLRLSSFQAFQAHDDEERRDYHDGKAAVRIRTPDGNYINAIVTSPMPAYVLCGSTTWPTDEQLADARYAYIAITDTTSFALAVARQIPDVTSGIEGFCMYNTSTLLPASDTRPFPAPRSVPFEELMSRLAAYMAPHIVSAYFLKRMKFVHEAEYRFIWMMKDANAKELHIKVPLARDFCYRVQPARTSPEVGASE